MLDQGFDSLKEKLEAVNEDLEKPWQYVPVDKPGNYLQCIPTMDKC